MLRCPDRRRRPLRGSLALLLLLALCATAAPGASAARRARHPGAALRSGSPYPAAASRPSFIPRPSQFARQAKPAPGAVGRTTATRGRSRKKPRKQALRGDPLRALLAFQAMQRYYYIQGSGLYSGEPFSYLWPFSQALAANVTLANVRRMPPSVASELRARLVGLRSYLDTNNSGLPEGTFTSTLAAFDGTVGAARRAGRDQVLRR